VNLDIAEPDYLTLKVLTKHLFCFSLLLKHLHNFRFRQQRGKLNSINVDYFMNINLIWKSVNNVWYY